jgi:hypothetical protein
MGNCCSFCYLFEGINWWFYLASVVTVYIIGAIWFSFLFAKMWIEANKIDVTEKGSTGNMVFTMLFQLFTTALLGLSIFVLVSETSWELAAFMVIAVAGWMKANLKFKFNDFKTFFKAAISEVGYFAVSAIVFILFALI